ncbi:hypothetical protein [Mesorhizobium loti]|uniref:Uncharacterized protein n=1 Tax=Mesorhizobium loti R88b TaxID=935548 RepID=A0A6M7WEC5_RHILI|nr:hypothetical protein [Mesorhizobium loti]QKD02170.1 hypothetical protein EB235_12195 [Mesorhizobium loti R88b]
MFRIIAALAIFGIFMPVDSASIVRRLDPSIPWSTIPVEGCCKHCSTGQACGDKLYLAREAMSQGAGVRVRWIGARMVVAVVRSLIAGGILVSMWGPTHAEQLCDVSVVDAYDGTIKCEPGDVIRVSGKTEGELSQVMGSNCDFSFQIVTIVGPKLGQDNFILLCKYKRRESKTQQ